MNTRQLHYRAGGLDAIGYLALPSGQGPHGAVLVCHEGPGQDDHVRWRAERLANEFGYVALALDYHGQGTVLEMDDYMARLIALTTDPAQMVSIATAALDMLVDQPSVDGKRVAVIGYCFGGTMALELARSGADLKAVVGFHSGLTMSELGSAEAITGRVHIGIGAEDPLIPAEQVETFQADMDAAGVDYTLDIHPDAGHSFTNAAADAWGVPGIAYNQRADESSWQAMATLLHQAIG